MMPISGSRSAADSASQPNSFLRRQGGFTLLEILLVLTLVAVASFFVVPNLTGLEARTFSAQLRQANALLSYARRTAVVSGQASSVSFNVVAREEWDQNQEENSQRKHNNVVAQWHGSGVALRFRDSTDREVAVEEAIEVTFYPEGGSSGGVLLFARAERQGIIDIDPFTGRITTLDSPE